MSRVCIAERPNSPKRDCCRSRYGSSSRVTSVATVGADIDSFPGGAGMELFRQIEAAVLAAKSSTGRRWDGRDFGDGNRSKAATVGRASAFMLRKRRVSVRSNH